MCVYIYIYIYVCLCVSVCVCVCVWVCIYIYLSFPRIYCFPKKIFDFLKIVFVHKTASLKLIKLYKAEVALPKLFQYTCFALPELPTYMFIQILVPPNHPTTCPDLTWTKRYPGCFLLFGANHPNSFFGLAKFSRQRLVLSKLFHVPLFSCHTRACCNYTRSPCHANVWIWRWDAFRRENVLAPTGR